MEGPFPAYKGDEPYLFVCYAHEDSGVVFPELQWLREQGVNIWYDEGISAGKNWREAIGDALLGASHFLSYISERSLKSDHCNREINLALDEGKEVVPVYLEDVELTSDLKVGLSRIHALHREQGASYQQHLLDALGQSASTPSQPVSSPVHRRLRWWHYTGLGLVLTILIGAAWVYSQYREWIAMPSIAVLPFTNVGTDEETRLFARGLSEDILDSLAQSVVVRRYNMYVKQLDVASGAASFQFADRGEDLSVIAEKLNVAYVLGGSVQRMGDRLRITTQLVRVEDNFGVWSRPYERAFADRFEMQQGVAQNIAHIAESELFFDIQKRIPTIFTVACAVVSPRCPDLKAEEHFMNAKNQSRLMNLGEGGDWALREEYLKKTVAVDPSFAWAYRMLANVYLQRVGGRMPLQESSFAAHAALTRAMELEPDSSYAELQIGQIYLYLDLDYANAEASFKRGLDRFPTENPTFHVGLARIALREGRVGEASRLMTTASALDAGEEQASFLNTYAWLLTVLGDYERSLKVSADGLNLVLGGPVRAANLRIQAAALIELERIEEAETLLEEAWDLDGSVRSEFYISHFARIGEKERAERILNDSQGESVSTYALAVGYLALEDIDNTFMAIEAAIEDHNRLLIDSLRTAAWWDPIRDDPRFDDMLDLLDSKVVPTQTYLDNLDTQEATASQ